MISIPKWKRTNKEQTVTIGIYQAEAERELALRMLREHVAGRDRLDPESIRRQLSRVTKEDILREWGIEREARA